MISMRFLRLYRQLSYLTAFFRDFRPGMQGLSPFSARYRRTNRHHSHDQRAAIGLWTLIEQGGGTKINAELVCSHEKAERATTRICIAERHS